MIAIIKYAIQNKYNGYYMPKPVKRNGRGGSHLESQPASIAEPRLFDSQRSAISFLNQWNRGKHIAGRGWDSGTFERAPEYYEDIKIIPVPGRDKADYNVVGIAILFDEAEIMHSNKGMPK